MSSLKLDRLMRVCFPFTLFQPNNIYWTVSHNAWVGVTVAPAYWELQYSFMPFLYINSYCHFVPPALHPTFIKQRRKTVFGDDILVRVEDG